VGSSASDARGRRRNAPGHDGRSALRVPADMLSASRPSVPQTMLSPSSARRPHPMLVVVSRAPHYVVRSRPVRSPVPHTMFVVVGRGAPHDVLSSFGGLPQLFVVVGRCTPHNEVCRQSRLTPVPHTMFCPVAPRSSHCAHTCFEAPAFAFGSM